MCCWQQRQLGTRQFFNEKYKYSTRKFLMSRSRERKTKRNKKNYSGLAKGAVLLYEGQFRQICQNVRRKGFSQGRIQDLKTSGLRICEAPIFPNFKANKKREKNPKFARSSDATQI